jgi:hypothetical protein
MPPYTTWATASDSIQKCINICNSGDTVVVANGIYKETLLIDSVLTLLGSSMDSCVIDGTGLTGNNGITIKANKYLSIQNFHVKGKGVEPLTAAVTAWYDSLIGGFLKIENSHSGIGTLKGATIENCFILNVNQCIVTGSDFNQDIYKIFNCILFNNQGDGKGVSCEGGIHYIYNNIMLGLHPSLFYGIELSLDNYSEVKNNLVVNYRDNNYEGGNYINGAVVENNTFLQYNASYDNVLIKGSDKTEVKNNIIAYAKQYGVRSGNGAIIDNNIFWKNKSASNVTLGANNKFADPMLEKDTIPTEAMNFDYHLQAYSPAIDAGDPNILDIDGSRSDIGMYGGPFGTTYTYKDLAPRPPVNLSAMVDSNEIILKWNKNTEADTNHYNIYRDTTQNFTLGSGKLIALQADTLLIEPINPNVSRYVYKITCVDNQGNESISSEEIVINLTSINDRPMTINDFALYQNYPNPFNSQTKIGYRLKESGYVKLMIYDIKAELIQILTNTTQEAGYHESIFDAEKFSSGIYLYRIEVIGENNIPRFSDMKKLILIK